MLIRPLLPLSFRVGRLALEQLLSKPLVFVVGPNLLVSEGSHIGTGPDPVSGVEISPLFAVGCGASSDSNHFSEQLPVLLANHTLFLSHEKILCWVCSLEIHGFQSPNGVHSISGN